MALIWSSSGCLRGGPTSKNSKARGRSLVGPLPRIRKPVRARPAGLTGGRSAETMELPLSSLLPAFKRLQLVYVALRIGLIARLGVDPSTSTELARSLGVPEARLVRILRGLIWAEILEMENGGRYRVAKEARVLLDESPTALAAGILFQGRFFYGAWGHLLDYLRDGSVPFERAHGQSIFALIEQDPSLSAEFNAPMAARTVEYSRAVSMLSVLRDARVIVDVAGGEGRLLTDILAEYPAARGVIFDLASVAGQAARVISETGLEDRCRFQPGDMFVEVPSGGDVYILKWVLHDWDNENVVQILRNVRQVMPRQAAVVIIERLMPEPVDARHPLVQADLNMLVLNGGAERTRSEYEVLIAQAGLRLDDVTSIESVYGFCALIAKASAG